tara:strand:+ start:119 stop:412 length:294 start_codon:yes stop_codon:yes gene_type:complete
MLFSDGNLNELVSDGQHWGFEIDEVKTHHEDSKTYRSLGTVASGILSYGNLKLSFDLFNDGEIDYVAYQISEEDTKSYIGSNRNYNEVFEIAVGSKY